MCGHQWTIELKTSVHATDPKAIASDQYYCWRFALLSWSLQHWYPAFLGPHLLSAAGIKVYIEERSLFITLPYCCMLHLHCHLSLRQHSCSVEWAVGVKTTAIFERCTRHSCPARSCKNSSSQSMWVVPFSASGGAGWCLGCEFDRAGRPGPGRDL